MSNELYAKSPDAAGSEVAGGVLLITGSVLGVLLMAHHPTGHELGADLGHLAMINVLVHGTAVATLPMMLLGVCAARRRLGPSNATDAAAVVYGFTSAAWMFAAVASGFVQTDLFSHMQDAPEEQQNLYGLLSELTHMFNQGFANVGVVASSISIGLLSWSIWRTRRMPRWLGVAGALAAIGVLIARLSGHVTLDVHGFGLIVLTQSAWFVCLGVALLKNLTRPY